MKNTIFLLCLTAIGCGSPSTKRSDPAPTNNKWSDARLASVLEAQDHRDSQALLVLLTDTATAVREAAAMAFISVQDTSARAGLMAAMHDAQPPVRLAAAWALSFVADTTAVKAIADQALKEKDPSMASAFYAASFRALTKAKPQLDPQELFSAFVKSNGYQRVCIAEALRRLPKETLATVERRYIELLQREMQPESKMLLLAGMKNFSDTLARKAVAELLNDPYPMIRVAALRAHAAINGNTAAPELLLALNDSFPAVRSTGVELLKGMDALDGEACWAAGQENADVMVKIALYGLAVQFGDEGTRNVAGSLMRSMWAQPADPYVRTALIDARALDPRGNIAADLLEPLIQKAGSSVERMHAFNAVMAFYGDKTTPEVEVLISTLQGSDDPGMIATVADFLNSSPAYAGFNMHELVAPLREKLVHLELPRDQEASTSIQQALAHLESTPGPILLPPPYNHPIDRTRLATLREGKEYRITTTKGDIVIAIEPNTAPGTCTAFDSLVTSGFYNGKYFHRVVPDFVAQGGCPRGDGFGAMDWTMRTENGYAGFATGAVGIASAGRDTESCQFFIMLAPAPHLDGRYTRFAHVVSGMDVAQKLVVGDAMTSVARTP